MPQGSRCRLKSPPKPPFVPPPARTTRVPSSCRSYDDEQRLRMQMSSYEKKVDLLLNEMGMLKNEADLERSKRDFEKKELLREREVALDELASLEHLGLPSDHLIRRLLEAEIDADQTAIKAQKLEAQLARIATASALHGRAAVSIPDCAIISEASQALRSKLASFHGTVRSLRTALRERQRSEAGNVALADQRETLLRKLADTDAECGRLRDELASRTIEANDLLTHVARERDAHTNASRERADLEAKLDDSAKRCRELEVECARLSDKARLAECNNDQRLLDLERARREADEQRDRAVREREAANKTVLKLRERLARADEALENAKREASEKEARATELNTASDFAARRADKANRDKAEMDHFVSQLRTRVEELEAELRLRNDGARKETDTLHEKLRERNNELSSLRAENERLRTAQTLAEQKLRHVETDYDRVHTTTKQDERQREDLRSEFQRVTREKEELASRLEDTQRQLQRSQKQAEIEMEQLRSRFQHKVHELEPLPDMLKTLELKVQEAREREQVAERRGIEQTRALADLTTKYEAAVEREAEARARYNAQLDECKSLANRLETTEKRVRELEIQTHELITTLSKRDEVLLGNASKLEEKARENAALARQLEQAIGDARHHNELSREKASVRELQLQARTSELDSQLAQARAETARYRRERDELEQRFNARILDLKDRLEQSVSTNRSMQTYVQFLKQSYTSVFNAARAETVTATSGFGDPSMTFDAQPIGLPMSASQIYSRPEMSSSSFSGGLLQTP